MNRARRPVIVVIASLFGLLSGCATRPPQPPPPVLAAAATTAPTQLSAAELTVRILGRDADAGAHAREFYLGDHLGMNLDLTLLAGGGYSLKYTGCQGLYGAAVGKWRVADGRVLLDPTDQQGRLAEAPIRVLHVRLMPDDRPPGDIALVPDDVMTVFMSDGVRDHTCFRPSSIVLSEYLR